VLFGQIIIDPSGGDRDGGHDDFVGVVLMHRVLPFEGGPRLALLYLAFEALRAYGVLDDKVRRHMHNMGGIEGLTWTGIVSSSLPPRPLSRR
jgi:hypothetical protein